MLKKIFRFVIKFTKWKFIIVIIAIVLLAVLTIIWYKLPHKAEVNKNEIAINDSTRLYTEREERWIDYFLDSTYRVLVDSQITVFKTTTGKKINSYTVGSFPLKSIIMHPSGKYLAVFDREDISVYDLTKKGKEPFKEISIDDDFQGVEFSKNGKYLMVFNYRDPEVDIYSFPGLKFLANQYLGFYRNSFWCEEHAGKLVFYYKEVREFKSYYRTEFPANPHARVLRFSKPVLIDSIPGKE